MTGIADLTVLSAAQVPGWLARASLPAGWRVGHYLGSEPNQPWRIAVRDPRPGDGWDACETITVWGFTGSPTTLDVRYYCESTMGGLDAEDIVVIEVETPAVPGVCAVSGGGISMLANVPSGDSTTSSSWVRRHRGKGAWFNNASTSTSSGHRLLKPTWLCSATARTKLS